MGLILWRLIAALVPRRAARVDEALEAEDWSEAIARPLRALLRDALAAQAAGRGKQADRLFARARELDAGVPQGDRAAQHFYTRGLMHLRHRRIDRARRCFDLAHRLVPNAAAPLGMLGFAGYFDGDTASARRDYDRALAVAAPAERGALRINRLIDTVPQIASSTAQLREERAWFERELDALLADPPQIADPLQEIHRTVFFLDYQGCNNRELHIKLARLFLRSTPSLAYVAAHAASARTPGTLGAYPSAAARRPSVGIVSMFLHKHSVGAWYKHFVRRLIESGCFECVLFTYLDKVDEELRDAADVHGRHVFLERTLEGARAQIEAARLDVLIYTDVAMHPFLYFLSFSRLAPVQALLVGHPGTSGVPTLDWFVSNVHQDREGDALHYGERLARLPLIPAWVQKTPPPSQRMSRAALGWHQRMRVYLCPMTLQKMHPDFDWALGEILRRDPDGEIVLFADRERSLWQTRLEERFARELPSVAGRIDFRPFAAREEFVNLLLEADCVLDPFHFSGGVTSYIALSLGVPVITLPGELFRSRMTAGMYAQLGVKGCVAISPEHYVELALAFAADPALRAQAGARITSAHARLFETDAAVDAFAHWIETVLED